MGVCLDILFITGETIKKKYSTILDMLKKERLTFGNQLEGLDNTLKKQDEEIEKLKVGYTFVTVFEREKSIPSTA